MAKKDIKLSDLSTQLKKVQTTFSKHASVIFVIAVLLGLVYSVSSVSLIIGAASDETYRREEEAKTTSTQFDKTTIQKIEALGDRQNPPEPSIPSGRINPFSD